MARWQKEVGKLKVEFKHEDVIVAAILWVMSWDGNMVIGNGYQALDKFFFQDR